MTIVETGAFVVAGVVVAVLSVVVVSVLLLFSCSPQEIIQKSTIARKGVGKIVEGFIVVWFKN